MSLSADGKESHMVQRSTRQRVRKALIIVSFLLFPVIMNYLSPYVIIYGASQRIVNGSLIMFGLMFLSALVVGRAWCGWLCPGGGVGEICFAVNDKPAHGGKANWIKWFIWAPWVGIIALVAVQAGGYRAGDFFLLTDHGISVTEPFNYIIYYLVIVLFVVPALIFGRRASCHYVCWMAPFMILGRKIRNLVGWPSLRLRAETAKCVNCQKCTANCPMSLDVNAMVQKGAMEHSECILCATCVDVCPKEVIHYTFRGGSD
jgi:ferredoxin-type protein NapH